MSKKILYLANKNAIVIEENNSKQLKTFDWDGLYLSQLFKLASGNNKTEFKLLLGSHQVYTAVLKLVDVGKDDENIIIEAKKRFPFDLSEENFHYRIKKTRDFALVQCMAIEPSFAKQLTELTGDQVKISSVNSFENLLANYYKDVKAPIALVYENPEKSVVIVEDGFIYLSVTNKTGFSEKDILGLLKHCHKQYGITVAKVALLNIEKELNFEEGVEVEKTKSGVIEGLLSGKLIKNDGGVIALMPVKKRIIPGNTGETKKKTEPDKTRRSKHILKKAALAAPVVVMTGLAFFLVNRLQDPQNVEVSRSASIEPTVSQVGTITPTSIDIFAYSVDVLNGGGKAGEASYVGSLLEAAGFKDLTLGNADNYEYIKTEVRVREELQGDVFTPIKLALSEYDVILGNPLPTDYERDIVIIIGKTKKVVDKE